MSIASAKAGGLVAAAALVLVPVPAALAQTERVAIHTDWSVFTPSEPRECYIASLPTASVARRDGDVVQVDRGEIRLYVTFRPAENVANEVSFTSGYPFREGSTVQVEVNGETFDLQAGTGEGSEWAWTVSPDEDQRLVAAFRRGSDARLTGVSSRGTTTEDTFSLMGFTAALDDAEARCS